MATSRTFNVLVAEDDAFQRLALLDILTLCDYEGKDNNIKLGLINNLFL